MELRRAGEPAVEQGAERGAHGLCVLCGHGSGVEDYGRFGVCVGVAYTSYGDVKRVKDPEGGEVQYVYDYELGEPAYGQVRKVVDALGRATEYWYYGANDANLARRGQVRRVEAPGGFWRELDYGGAGWLVRREVQTADGSEVTAYTHDAWGRLRAIDYPRSADVRMGWDGESRRVWVQDGAGRREYTYDAWGRVMRQEGCCGNELGVLAVEARYDRAGRRTETREVGRWGITTRTVYTFYDGLGRVKAIGTSPEPPGSDGGVSNVIYHYDSAGRLWKEAFPNGNHFIHTYYGAEAPDQQGQLKSIQLCLGDCTAVDEWGNPEGEFGLDGTIGMVGSGRAMSIGIIATGSRCGSENGLRRSVAGVRLPIALYAVLVVGGCRWQSTGTTMARMIGRFGRVISGRRICRVVSGMRVMNLIHRLLGGTWTMSC
jgi:hypothetical protein